MNTVSSQKNYKHKQETKEICEKRNTKSGAELSGETRAPDPLPHGRAIVFARSATGGQIEKFAEGVFTLI